MAQNLIPMPYESFKNGNTTIGTELTFTLNEDGSITVNGCNPNDASYCDLIYWGNLAAGEVDAVATLKGCPAGGGVDTYSLILSGAVSANDYGAGASFTLNQAAMSDNNVELTISVQKGVVMDNVVFRPFVGVLSMAEKLVDIAENEQKVYDAGVKAGQAAGGYDEGYAAGKQAEYDFFWDTFQQNGNRTNYLNGFSGNWTDAIFKPKYNIVPVGNTQQLFAGTQIKNLADCIEKAGIIFDTSKATNLAYMFNNSSTIEEVPNIDVSNATSIGWLFNMCISLEKASVTFGANKTTSYSNVFARCDNLEELTVAGVIDIPLSLPNSSKLTDASVQSIIDHLADLTGKTAQTLTFHATVGGKLTDAQKAACTAKNWTLVY